MKIDTVGLDLIKKFEGFSSKPYLCPAGIPTIGYGNTYYEDGTKVKLTDAPITKERATEILNHVVATFAESVNEFVKIKVTQNQFNALVSLAYNIGLGNFSKSTVLRKLNIGDYEGAASSFLLWRKAGGKVVAGLVNRREAEKKVFLS
ncbi:MAG TPA: lysozyme [Patescibacteria group bacterium]|nr:lysozyme [Patescibacteria group bacterium]